jgi:hypothetical protein
MKHIFSNIREYKLMYLSSIIGYNSYIIGFDIGLQNVFINKIDNDQKIYNFLETNTFIYSSILSEYGGLSQLKFNLNDIHYFTKLNEIVFDNINNFDKIQNEFKKNIKDYLTSPLKIDILNENTINILQLKGDHNKYYSLLFIAVPFALKINNKNELIDKITKFISIFTKDIYHILSAVIIGLFINYSINEIPINIWIDNIKKDLIKEDKYLDFIKNYYDNNFRNGKFINNKIDNYILIRTKNFFDEYCNKNNKILTENPHEQVLLIYDTLIRSNDNWEKLIFNGMLNYNDNIGISLILGLIYEIIFSSSKINKNLLKRFSFKN